MREQGAELYDFGFGNDFLDMTQEAQATKAKRNRTTSDFKASAQRRKRSTGEKVTYGMEKMTADRAPDIKLVTRIYRNSHNSVTTKKSINSI